MKRQHVKIVKIDFDKRERLVVSGHSLIKGMQATTYSDIKEKKLNPINNKKGRYPQHEKTCKNIKEAY